VTSNKPSVIDGLDVNEVKDGLIVYESESDRVHYLNATASIVFTLCDGSHSAAEMAEVISVAFGLDRPPTGDVDECLETLAKEGLLQ
jgi:hypothetical protein